MKETKDEIMNKMTGGMVRTSKQRSEAYAECDQILRENGWFKTGYRKYVEGPEVDMSQLFLNGSKEALKEFVLSDSINPYHYRQHGGVQCIEIAEKMEFCRGNSFKYFWRHSLKGGNEDLEKCIWYLDRLVHGGSREPIRWPLWTTWRKRKETEKMMKIQGAMKTLDWAILWTIYDGSRSDLLEVMGLIRKRIDSAAKAPEPKPRVEMTRSDGHEVSIEMRGDY